mmetsp:Transcript_6523/g.22310  ORF Transcript_6523/g.22310 Transcript_6523/m.22310 type:complete len:271 (+) Transcript_6523:682-1494(+)
MATTGPKVSRRLISASWGTSESTVAGKKLPLAEAPSLMSARHTMRAPASSAEATWALTRSRWRAETSGPMRAASSAPSAATYALAFSAQRASNLSLASSATYTRSTEQHTWPQLKREKATASSAALSRSASEKTTIGSLPPSSRTRRLREGAQSAMICLPVAEEPVMATMSTSPCTRALPTTPSPCTSSSTPAGSADWSAFATSAPTSGVTSEGLSTTALPAARAGRVRRRGSSAGKFHGEHTATTPCGSRTTRPFPETWGVLAAAMRSM